MKKIIFILFLFAAFSTLKAQSVDTIKSVALGDSIAIQHVAIEIQPIIADALGDTARSLNFYAFGVQSDSTQGCNTYVQVFDKNCKSLFAFNQPIPANILNQWKADPTVIFTYILFINQRFKRP